ncbi:MAG TPA: alpha/beta fold hydrolase [Kofleriaceae bacterium]|nr:alpha/beta fold hydrolase [Kofleriaceae bacterium]
MVTGVYPLVPHLLLAASRRRKERAAPAGEVGVALREWARALAMTARRPLGFCPLPGHDGHGPRPIIVLHGYAMGRSNFRPLARRLAAAGLGPVIGFEYWSLGKTSSAARRLGALIEEVRAQTGAAQVDVIGHSMGGVVGRYLVSLGGGDGVVANLVTIGSPHRGTDASAIGIGRPAKELLLGSSMVQRLDAAPPPAHTRMTVVWSRADALVPGARQARVPGAEELLFDDLGHLGLLTDRRVAAAIIERLAR